MVAETKESYVNFDIISRKSAHRHDLRMGVVLEKSLRQDVKEKFGGQHFRPERWGMEALFVKTKDNNTFSFVDEGRMLDQFNYIHKQSLLAIDALDRHTAQVLATLDVPLFVSFLHTDIDSVEKEFSLQQQHYVGKTLEEVRFKILIKYK
jgi:hypothetical protein